MRKFGIWISLAFTALLCSSTPASVVFIPEPSLYGYMPNYFSGTNSRVEYHVYCDGTYEENLERVELLLNDELVAFRDFPPFWEMETEKARLAAMFDPTHFGAAGVQGTDVSVKMRALVSGTWYEHSYTRPTKTTVSCFQQVLGYPYELGQRVVAAKLLGMGYGPIWPYYPNFTSAQYWDKSQVSSIVGYTGHGGPGEHQDGSETETISGIDWRWYQPGGNGYPGPDGWLFHRQPLFQLPAPLNQIPMVNLLYLDACNCLDIADFQEGALHPHLNAYWDWPWFIALYEENQSVIGFNCFTFTNHSERMADIVFTDLSWGNSALHAHYELGTDELVEVADTDTGPPRPIQISDVILLGDPYTRIKGVYLRNHTTSTAWYKQLH